MDSGLGREIAKAEGVMLLAAAAFCVALGAFGCWLLGFLWTHISVAFR